MAARGLDVDGIDIVVNYDMPNNMDAYVHRIGRTGRCGRKGLAVSLAASLVPRSGRKGLAVSLTASFAPRSGDVRERTLGYL